jgi:hypothetical protein
MKVAVRVFALLVAFVGLASASFSSTKMQTLPSHMSSAVSGPAPMALPAPLPCQSVGDCVAPTR